MARDMVRGMGEARDYVRVKRDRQGGHRGMDEVKESERLPRH